jgi:hypothetical protein
MIARPIDPARFAHFFSSPPAAKASTRRQSAYAANPIARRVSTTSPNVSRASAWSAPSRLVALPPWPAASLIASTPTIANETPFATSPARASHEYQPLPLRPRRRASWSGWLSRCSSTTVIEGGTGEAT